MHYMAVDGRQPLVSSQVTMLQSPYSTLLSLTDTSLTHTQSLLSLTDTSLTHKLLTSTSMTVILFHSTVLPVVCVWCVCGVCVCVFVRYVCVVRVCEREGV